MERDGLDRPDKRHHTLTSHGVWGSDANNVWAVGELGHDPEVERDDLGRPAERHHHASNGVWGATPTMSGPSGTAGRSLKWNGTAWAAQTSGTTSILYSVWGADANNVWAVGRTAGPS